MSPVVERNLPLSDGTGLQRPFPPFRTGRLMKSPLYLSPQSSADRAGQTRRSISWHLFGWSAAAFVLVGAHLPAQETGGVGRCASPAASILRRATGDKHWKAVQAREALQSDDLLVALPGAAVDSKNGAVRLSLLEDLAGQSLYPVIETAVMLHDGKGVDLEFTLDRGRVTIANRKERGSAQVRVRLRDQTWELTLAEPGARVALEIYGRWPAGSRFARDAKTKEGPAADVVVLVLEGQVDLRAGNQEQALRAPPGPAYFHWDSTAGLDATPGRLEKVPDWADPKAGNTPRSRQIKARAEMLRQRLLQESLENALAEAAQSGDTTY